jgi:hypothetical protein
MVTRTRKAVFSLLPAAMVVAASSPAAAGKPTQPSVGVRVTINAPAVVTVGQAFTLTGTATDIDSGASLCPASAESLGSVASSVPSDVITMNADGCSATVTASTAGVREISFYFAKPYQRGQAGRRRRSQQLLTLNCFARTTP